MDATKKNNRSIVLQWLFIAFISIVHVIGIALNFPLFEDGIPSMDGMVVSIVFIACWAVALAVLSDESVLVFSLFYWATGILAACLFTVNTLIDFMEGTTIFLFIISYLPFIPRLAPLILISSIIRSQRNWQLESQISKINIFEI